VKAIIQTQYGKPDILQLREVEKPSPKENEVLSRVQAASVNAYDWHMLTADIFLVRLMGGGFRKPKKEIPGADMAGIVVAVGSQVTQFKPGDAVYGDIAGAGSGAFAEYATALETQLAPKPVNLTFEQAAAVPMAAITALQALRDEGKVQPGQKVVIQGAGGGVGTFAVQLARFFGAEVTAVCSTRNLEQSRSLGAHHVIDYTQEDFTRNGQRYDLILGVNGYHSLSDYKRALADRGVYLMAGGSTGQILQGFLLASRMTKAGGIRMGSVSAHHSQKDLLFLKELLESGVIIPVVDRVFPFHETPAALGYLGTGHARGKVVITIGSGLP
jgi:NADPH:quinone reductase-like Zn-dependent oxidoreductase